jgi:hypothetical protein
VGSGIRPVANGAEPLCDGHRVVAETLVIAADQGGVHRLFHTV